MSLLSILTIVLGVLAIVVYKMAVTKGKSWGVPVMVLLVVGAVATLVLGTVASNFLSATIGQGTTSERYRPVRVAAEGFKDELPSEARVLILQDLGGVSPEDQEDARQEAEAAVQGALGSGAELVEFDMPGLDDPDAGISLRDPGFLNEVFEKYSDEDIDLCIFMTRPPRGGMRDTGIESMPDDMLFVANLRFRYDPGQVEDWISEGAIDGVTVHLSRTGDEMVLITEDSLSDLPSESPL